MYNNNHNSKIYRSVNRLYLDSFIYAICTLVRFFVSLSLKVCSTFTHVPDLTQFCVASVAPRRIYIYTRICASCPSRKWLPFRLSGFTYLVSSGAARVCAWWGLREAQLKAKTDVATLSFVFWSFRLSLSSLSSLFLSPFSLSSPVARWWMADCRGEGGGVCDQQPGLCVFLCVCTCICVCVCVKFSLGTVVLRISSVWYETCNDEMSH